MRKAFCERVWTVCATELRAAIKAVRRDLPEERIVKLVIGEDTFWMKQAEIADATPSAAQSETLAQALEGERENLIAFRKDGFPVPDVVHHAPGFLVISDCGLDLRDVMITTDHGSSEVIRAFYQAGHALGRLHSAGLSLGRGRPKDFCWDGKGVHFIDLEQRPAKFAASTTGVLNLRNFTVATMKYALDHQADGFASSQAFLRGYASVRTDATRQSLAAARSWARRRWWLVWASTLYGRLLAGANNHRKAYAPALLVLAEKR